MTVEQGQAWLVGNKVHHGPAVIRNYDRVFYNPTRFDAIHLHQFELVAMQMKRMCIIRAVAKHQPVASSLLQYELTLVGIRLSVYQPGIELARSAGNFF